MIFQLGRKNSEDESVRQETFRRWREASLKSQEQEGSGLQAPAVDESVRLIVGEQSAHQASNNSSSKIEEIKMDSMRAVEWPDPRAPISLSKEAEQLEFVSVSSSAEDSFEQMQSSTEGPLKSTSRLAQFVSSGLSAAGLSTGGILSGTKTPTAPVKTAKVEVLRNVAGAPLEVERLPSGSSSGSGNGLSISQDIMQKFGSNIKSALGPGTIIEGTFRFDTPVCIEGTLIGEVISNSLLVVGEQATVNAKIKVGSLVVFGQVCGDVESEELVDIKQSGSLKGDVISSRLAIEDGGWFQGRSTPTSLKVKGSKVIHTEEVVVGTALATCSSQK